MTKMTNSTSNVHHIGILIDSIDSDGEKGVEAAWVAEIERRIVELDVGEVKTIPWDVVRDGLRQRLGG